jgi:hypothetical protein
MNINPRNLTVKTWCDFNVPLLARYGQVPFLQNEADWQQWGVEICKVPGVAGFNPPDPRFFTNFYDWAAQFNSAVPL